MACTHLVFIVVGVCAKGLTIERFTLIFSKYISSYNIYIDKSNACIYIDQIHIY